MDTVSLDDLASGKLPERIISAIKDMELTIGDMAQWEKSRPATRITLTKGYLIVDVRFRARVKKIVAVLCGTVTLAATLANLIAKYWPAIQNLIHTLSS